MQVRLGGTLFLCMLSIKKGSVLVKSKEALLSWVNAFKLIFIHKNYFLQPRNSTSLRVDCWVMKWLGKNNVSAKLEIRYTWSSISIRTVWLTDLIGKGRMQFHRESDNSVLFGSAGINTSGTQDRESVRKYSK